MADNPGMKLVPLALAAVVLSVFASSASARPADFCGTARGVAGYLVHSGNMISPTGGESLATLEHKLKTTYAAMIHAEPALKAQAPASIKADLLKAFSVINFINAKMTSVGWDFTKVAPFAQSLAAKAAGAKPALTHLSVYFKGTCHIAGA
jgi:hypothetical protein